MTEEEARLTLFRPPKSQQENDGSSCEVALGKDSNIDGPLDLETAGRSNS